MPSMNDLTLTVPKILFPQMMTSLKITPLKEASLKLTLEISLEMNSAPNNSTSLKTAPFKLLL